MSLEPDVVCVCDPIYSGGIGPSQPGQHSKTLPTHSIFSPSPPQPKKKKESSVLVDSNVELSKKRVYLFVSVTSYFQIITVLLGTFLPFGLGRCPLIPGFLTFSIIDILDQMILWGWVAVLCIEGCSASSLDFTH
jgi:hypothetical protein